MKISTKFNLFVGFFFLFVFLAVFYSYCGGLNVCYSFPFLNGIRSGPVPKTKVMMTSYIFDEKGESRDEASNTIYFYGKVKDNSQRPKEGTRKPGDEDITRKKTGSHYPPSDITGKVALDILRRSNISLEEANRTLFREEKIDKQVDREDVIKLRPLLTQSTPITKDRGGLGLKYKHPRIYPIRRPPRKLRKKLRKNRINRFSKQDRIDRKDRNHRIPGQDRIEERNRTNRFYEQDRKGRINQFSKQDRIDQALERKLERAEVAKRMHGYGPGNESRSLKTSYLRKNATNQIMDLKNMSPNQTEEKTNFINEAINPLDVLKYRNEAITYKKRHRDEVEWKNTKLTPKFTQELKNNTKNSTLYPVENKQLADKNLNYKSEKGLPQTKEKLDTLDHSYNFDQTKENKLFSEANGVRDHSNNVTSSGGVKTKREKKKKKKKRVDEGSGTDDDGSGTRRYTSLSTGELIRSIRDINDQHIKQTLQSALNKDEQQLKDNVEKIKTSLEESYRPFNLTKVLKDLVTAADNHIDQGEQFPVLKQEILLKRRNTDWDKPLVRVKRLGRVRRRNDQSEKTLIRVKRLEEEDEDPSELNLNKGYPGGGITLARRSKTNDRKILLKKRRS